MAAEVLAGASGATPDTSMLLAGAESTARAAAHFRRSTELAPRSAEFWSAWAAFHVRREEFDAAEPVLQDAVRAQPQDSVHVLTLIDSLARRRGPEPAIQELRKAIAARPRDHALRLALADLLRSADRSAEADAALKALVAEVGDAPAGLTARNRLAMARLAPADEVLKSNPPRQHRAVAARAHPSGGGTRPRSRHRSPGCREGQARRARRHRQVGPGPPQRG